MDAARRQQLIKRRAVAKASLTRMQNFLESGDLKVNKITVRFDELPGIFNKYDTAQDELEVHDNADQSADRELFEKQYFEVKAKFNKLLHPVVEQPLSRRSSPRSSLSEHSIQSPWSRGQPSH
jgi:DNA repair exonuclease SbcCD ATPase subunit